MLGEPNVPKGSPEGLSPAKETSVEATYLDASTFIRG